MNIYEAVLEINSKIPNVEKMIGLWKVEQAIDNNKSFIVPSFIFYSYYEKYINKIDDSLLGLPYKNLDFIHSLFVWSMNPRTVVVSESVMDFIYQTSLLDYISPELLFAFPSQAILVNQKFGNYDGILFCKDCLDEGIANQYSLNISLFSNDGRYSKYFSIPLPTVEKFNPFQDLKAIPDWGNIAFVFYVLLYVLSEFLHKQDVITQNGTDYLGFRFEEKIEQHKFKEGRWRKAHWHTYKEKLPNGRERKLIKWIQPIWMND